MLFFNLSKASSKRRDRSTGLCVAIVLALYSLSADAQLPELAATTLTGDTTSARFYAGVSADNGQTFGSNFLPSDLLDINGEIQVEAAHIGQSGNLYLILGMGEQYFFRNQSGDYIEWDLSAETLQPTASKTLAASETIVVLDDVAFGPFDLAGFSFTMFLAYDTGNINEQLYFSEVPAAFSIAASDPVDATEQALSYFNDNVSTQIIQNICRACHVDGGAAQFSDLQYLGSNQAGHEQANFNTLLDYILNAPNGAQDILAKPQGGNGHLGGAPLPAGSENLDTWSTFVDLVLAIPGQHSNQQAIINSVELVDDASLLRKAALLFAGRLPSEAELAQVASANDAQLRDSIRSLMDDDGFKTFLTEGANDRLLSMALAGYPYIAINRYYYPAVDDLLNNYDFRDEVRMETGEAIAREPLELIAHVVMEERPYTEILTADYTMMNPYSAAIYNSSLPFDNYEDANEWREGRITDYYRCTICAGPNPLSQYTIPTDYPHAGLLNSPMFLARFPSTDTNRNRARSRWAYYFFLGVDIEGLAPRTTDQAALSDEDNPTLNNPNCTVCHTVMDPVAGAFQFYGDEGRYKDSAGGNDALPNSYKFDPEGLYLPGDVWYSDMLPPGFGELIAPNEEATLQWLAQQFVQDSRFGYGAVNFWFPAIMGREPLPEPENPEDADYLASVIAYNAEQAMMSQVAADFVNGAQGNGTHNLKDMLVDLVMTPHFRAMGKADLGYDEEIQLEGVGIGKLLTPEQLNRKLIETTGYNWSYGRNNALTSVYGLLYGGIDSDGVTERATDLTALMSSVVSAMANEASCPIVVQDFSKPQSQRILFTEVQMSTTPQNGEQAIRENIQYLHAHLLGEELASNSTEVSATYNLFYNIWESRIASGKGDSYISVDEICLDEAIDVEIDSDPQQVLRPWIAVINYMLRDFRFIHE